ncbi:NADPH--cytochrome P450 reductase [Geodia barretti]|nr:NADPH--cytochrome P450 reductase [Geodia barretti]
MEGSLAVFCVATYGEGDPTDNAQELYDWLKNGDVDLSSLNYTVFALGNKTYEHYNAMGRFVDQRLEELGATRVFQRGEGDDDANIEEDFVTWSEALWPAVCQRFGVDSALDTSNVREYAITVHSDLSPERVFTGEPLRLGSFANQKPPFNSKNPFLAPIRVIRELHKGGERSCMHVELDIAGSRLNYVAGDHLALFPSNDPRLVDRVGELLGVDLDTVFSLTSTDEAATKKTPFPCPTTYRTALSYYVDITSPPRTNVLKELAEYATDPKDKEFLLKITSSSDDGKHQYREWVLEDRRTLVAVLEDLPSSQTSSGPPGGAPASTPGQILLHLLLTQDEPDVSPRHAVLIDYTTRTGRRNMGVATGWLKRHQQKVQNGEVVLAPISIRHSSLRLPYHSSKPVIMVGPGTGLAPFRGFIQDRAAAKQSGKELGETVLFFGCRHRAEDYIYEEELEGYRDNGVLSGLQVAFSRDQADKVYVQHLLRESGAAVWELLEKQGYFYICGDARHMARDVMGALLELIQDNGHMDSQAASEYVKKLQKRNRFLQDVWS